VIRRFVLALLLALGISTVNFSAAHAAGCMPCAPGPPPTHFGPYGGYGLWNGTCPPTNTARPPGRHPYGEITTHWDEYRGHAVVRYLEIAASFSATTTPKPPVPRKGYTNVFNVIHPAWGAPIQVGMGHPGPNQTVGRHQDGPLYLVFDKPSPHSVIAVEFLWLDANHHVLWKSPQPLYWRC
jgi:hypothetical protein